MLQKEYVRLTLAELRSATCGFETVLLPLLHSGVTGQETCLLEGCAIFCGINVEKSTGNAVTDCACLSGVAAAVNIDDDIELAESVGKHEGSANDHLEGFIAEIFFEIPLVDFDNAGAGNETNAGNGAFAPAGSEILSGCCHGNNFLP